MKSQQKQSSRLWYTAKLTPMATGIYTDGFYPTPKRGTGAQYVFFTQIDNTPRSQKVIVASRLAESGIRMMSQELAAKCLIPSAKATIAEMKQLDELTQNLKL